MTTQTHHTSPVPKSNSNKGTHSHNSLSGVDARLRLYRQIALESGHPDRFIRIKEATQLTSLSNTRHFQMEKEGIFPQRIRVGHRCSGYRLSDVLAWLADPASYRAVRQEV
ncbi:phage transcriptional regulator, AlpA [Ferrimonas balearica DSM 9799]|uniref:Phage transcriptional regulator, AlpA n=1 Tax=Ferrimonas balearica (strain DSM 9799 / CCM 4581 / KCTC 23876 / PAT) TaxID=550540 RepID=E1SP30_FERBD|nr:phage transcriptional regulator, AlpA [Ferrimonas balearica DSM 9799]